MSYPRESFFHYVRHSILWYLLLESYLEFYWTDIRSYCLDRIQFISYAGTIVYQIKVYEPLIYYLDVSMHA